ncbi:MAG: GDP-mannose 4,6-dehydratase [Proteobacteria bacterium]|nr:GDP-mannose 4,6-dehydratase [Pseudomonadota bacterium]
MAKSALIIGIGGQDGAYLADLLLSKGYAVHGTSRDREVSSFANLRRLGILDRVKLYSAVTGDFRSILQVVRNTAPDEIYNLAGQTSVGLSFEQPVETLNSITVGTLNILEAIRFLDIPTRFYNAASGEMFGNTGTHPAHEDVKFAPRSPYGVGKAGAFWATANYRESYSLFACSGILFNHESPLRPPRFVTQKVVRGALDIAEGREKSLKLGNLGISRDWGWAPEYVVAMWAMLQQETPEDFVIATGQNLTLERFVARAFERVGLDWRRHVEVDRALYRPSDILASVGDPSRARDRLGWRATVAAETVVEKLVDAEIERRKVQAEK